MSMFEKLNFVYSHTEGDRWTKYLYTDMGASVGFGDHIVTDIYFTPDRTVKKGVQRVIETRSQYEAQMQINAWRGYN